MSPIAPKPYHPEANDTSNPTRKRTLGWGLGGMVMFCYRDMTFCTFEQCDKWLTCPNALTDEVQKAANHWWGKPDAPVCMFCQKPKCFEEQTP